MINSCNALEDEEGWVLVSPEKDNNSFWQGCKNNGKLVVKYYERAKLLYNVYRVVKLLVHMYIIYHTLHPLTFL